MEFYISLDEFMSRVMTRCTIGDKMYFDRSETNPDYVLCTLFDCNGDIKVQYDSATKVMKIY